MTKAAELAKMGEVLTNSQIGGRRNIVINGGMICSQRATSVTGLGASSGYFTLDRFKMVCNNTAGRFTMTQTADGPSGFANCLKLDCTTADTSIASNEEFGILYRMEGQDLQQFKKGTSGALRKTLSFYVKGNASATYVVELMDSDNSSRHIGATFSVTTDWTRVEITFPGDTTGALDDDNAASLDLQFFLHAGSNNTSGTLQTDWGALAQANRAVGISSFFDSTDRTFFLTGVQLEVGSVATPFEHASSFGEQLSLCQRYYEFLTGGISPGLANTTSTSQASLKYMVEKRASPTTALVGTPFVNDGSQQSNITAITNYHNFTGGQLLQVTGTVNNNEAVNIYSNSVTTGISLDSEL
jgi:hypothetical protein